MTYEVGLFDSVQFLSVTEQNFIVGNDPFDT